MSKSILRLAALFAPLLLLSACGEGWEAQKTTTAFPYGQRTAGSGVVYVRAQLLPKKELKLEQITSEQAAAATQVEKPQARAEVTLSADKIFIKAQTKTTAPPPPSSEEKPQDKPENKPEETTEESPETEKHSSKNKLGEKAASDVETAMSPAEKYIAAKPKQMQTEKTIEKTIEVSDIEARDISDIEPSAGTPATSNVGFIAKDDLDEDLYQIFGEEETIEIYENEVLQPTKQIVVPKQDFVDLDLRSKGEKSLDEIYNDEFINNF